MLNALQIFQNSHGRELGIVCIAEESALQETGEMLQNQLQDLRASMLESAAKSKAAMDELRRQHEQALGIARSAGEERLASIAQEYDAQIAAKVAEVQKETAAAIVAKRAAGANEMRQIQQNTDGSILNVNASSRVCAQQECSKKMAAASVALTENRLLKLSISTRQELGLDPLDPNWMRGHPLRALYHERVVTPLREAIRLLKS